MPKREKCDDGGVDRIRLSFQVSRSVKDRIERLADVMGAESLTQVIRQSLLLCEQLTKIDGKIFVKEGDSMREIQILGLVDKPEGRVNR